jgi:hypothetical protein
LRWSGSSRLCDDELIYRLPKAQADGSTQLRLTPLELIERGSMSYPARDPKLRLGIDSKASAACRRRASLRVTTSSCRGGRVHRAPAHPPPPLSRRAGTQFTLTRRSLRWRASHPRPRPRLQPPPPSRALPRIKSGAGSVGRVPGAHLRNPAPALQPVRG